MRPCSGQGNPSVLELWDWEFPVGRAGTGAATAWVSTGTNSLLGLSTFQPRGSGTPDLLGNFPAHPFPMDEPIPSSAAPGPNPTDLSILNPITETPPCFPGVWNIPKTTEKLQFCRSWKVKEQGLLLSLKSCSGILSSCKRSFGLFG